MDTGHKIVQKLRAAERTAADAEAAEHFGLVAHADLTQLDAGAEHAREVAHELAKVHAPLGGEEEHDLAPSKLHSTRTSFMSSPRSAIFRWQMPKASFSR